MKLGYSNLEWQPAKVPGHVHLDLVNCGIIADPFERQFELGAQWVDEQDWIYRTTFEFEPDPRFSKRVLRFEGLDTICKVYLNGTLVGQSDNMFVPIEFDVNQALVAGVNELRVEFESPWRIGRERRQRYFAAEGLPSTTVRLEAPAFVRKAQYMFGWDWGPCLPSAGIFRPVELIECTARLRNVAVSQRPLPDGRWELEICSEHEGSGDIWHYVEGFDAPVRDGTTLVIDAPRLWWPRDLGQAELYDIESVLVEASMPPSRDGVNVLDRRSHRIGLRTIELVREPDRFGESFRFVVNGREFYALGANWIPDDSFPSRVDRARVEAQLRRACDMGMNMLRVWGGGLYESEDFYDLCDELGLLVWQDFPYACSYYPDDATAREVAKYEATIAIERLRIHPSLAIWCGNNENQTMRDGGWEGAENHPPRLHGEHIFDGVLPRLLTQLDPTRPYIPSSPTGKGLANSGGDGDQHYWDVWHGRGDFIHYRDSTARFCSEFGFASAPSKAVWDALGEGSHMASKPPRDRIARWHDKTAKGYETFLGFVELHYPKSETLEEWTYYSQLNQRDALRFGIEHYRRSEFCRGALIWQLNDCWPVQSWAVVDSAFRYKAAAYELRRLYSPLVVCLERRDDVLQVWAVLDNTRASYDGTCKIEIRSLSDGTSIERREPRFGLAPGERRVIGTIELSRFAPTQTIVTADVEGRRGFLLLAEPKELHLAAVELTLSRDAGAIVVDTGGVPVVDLCLTDEDGRAEFLDNFLTITEPGACVLRVQGRFERLRARSLAGPHPIRWKG